MEHGNELSTYEFALNAKMGMGCRYLRVVEGCAGLRRGSYELFRSVVAFYIALFDCHKRFFGFAVLVTFHMEELQSNRFTVQDRLVDGQVDVAVIVGGIVWASYGGVGDIRDCCHYAIVVAVAFYGGGMEEIVSKALDIMAEEE